MQNKDVSDRLITAVSGKRLRSPCVGAHGLFFFGEHEVSIASGSWRLPWRCLLGIARGQLGEPGRDILGQSEFAPPKLNAECFDGDLISIQCRPESNGRPIPQGDMQHGATHQWAVPGHEISLQLRGELLLTAQRCVGFHCIA